jgi:hypothetical protein
MPKTLGPVSDEVVVYGSGSIGGKGAGLVKLDQCRLPRVGKLRTRILSTSFYDRFLDRGGRLGKEETEILSAVLKEFADLPLGVRSSATNEALAPDKARGALHAGENASFMLPNNHPDPGIRLRQCREAIGHIYADFRRRPASSEGEKMAIVINPIHGVFDDTFAGPCYYPYISGVANSFFPHALKSQNPKEGFARIAFGHGYAVVLDDFPVISMATIRNPLPLKMLQIGIGQQYFYALDMTKNSALAGTELETMKKLHVRFANFHKVKLLGTHGDLITIEELIQNDHFGFKSGLAEIMEAIRTRIAPHFQIEFIFNLDFARKDRGEGTFHIVQLTPLPGPAQEAVNFPKRVRRTYLSIDNAQGHGVKTNIKFAVVVSPFLYAKDLHDRVRARISELNRQLRERGEDYLLIVPGRLGSKNRDWGIDAAYKDVDHASAIFEYGVDIAGREEPLPEDESLTGGIYGSHFLYMIQGGYDEDRKRLQTRMYGTQGTHFLTNLMSGNIIYGYVPPTPDSLDPWFFSSPDQPDAVSVLAFPKPVTIFADSLAQRCQVVLGHG